MGDERTHDSLDLLNERNDVKDGISKSPVY